MIDITKLTKEHINRLVVYKAHDNAPVEQGRITSWNDQVIFVDYTNVGRGQATAPSQLSFI